MNTDCFFTMGKQHTVCQDYALATSDAFVLSDGCSSSPHTDIGSRLLCHKSLPLGISEGTRQAADVLSMLAIPTAALDATVLLGRWSPDLSAVQVFVHGDGVVVGRRRDGTHIIINVSYPSGAPLYPSYDLDERRKKGYAKEFGTERETEQWEQGQFSTHSTPLLVNGVWSSAMTMYEFSVEVFDLVLILSDGATSFRKLLPNGQIETIPLPEIVREVLAIKGYAGSFLTRRARRFLLDASRKGWHHDDDFSVAGIYLGEL